MGIAASANDRWMGAVENTFRGFVDFATCKDLWTSVEGVLQTIRLRTRSYSTERQT
jgi:hypothetical protein